MPEVTQPMRQVFKMTDEGEQLVGGLLAIKNGEMFRMKPPPGYDDPFLDQHWRFALSDGYVNENGIESIQCGKVGWIITKAIEDACQPNTKQGQ